MIHDKQINSDSFYGVAFQILKLNFRFRVLKGLVNSEIDINNNWV